MEKNDWVPVVDTVGGQSAFWRTWNSLTFCTMRNRLARGICKTLSRFLADLLAPPLVRCFFNWSTWLHSGVRSFSGFVEAPSARMNGLEKQIEKYHVQSRASFKNNIQNEVKSGSVVIKLKVNCAPIV